MNVVFKTEELRRLDAEPVLLTGYPTAVVSAYRGRLQLLRAAPREEAIRALRCLHMEANTANGAHTLRITDGWNLLVAFQDGGSDREAVIEAIVPRGKATRE
jgi:proteic killer suppression protein